MATKTKKSAAKKAEAPKKPKKKPFTFLNGAPFFNGTEFTQVKSTDKKGLKAAKKSGFRKVSVEFFTKHAK